MAPYIPLFQSLITATGVITAAVVAAVLARRGYVRQKEIDRKEDLRNIRADEYESYIKAFREVTRHAERLHRQGGRNEKTEYFLGEAHAKYDEAYNYLAVIASDDVFRRATALHDRLSEHLNAEAIDTDKMRADKTITDLYTHLIVAIRRDCFEESTLLNERIDPHLNW